MTKTVHIDCNGRSVDDCMREMTRHLDAHIARVLAADERSFWCRGAPPHEIEETMRQARAHIQAWRDVRLAEMRRDLAEWWN
jgi:hypothetical protein